MQLPTSLSHLRRVVHGVNSRLGIRGRKKLDKNIIVFTTHKAGSMVVDKVLREFCEKNGVAHYSPTTETLPFDRIFNGEDFIASRTGLFGPLRFFAPSSALQSARVILHLRDPRDVLTSMFFSYCFMHPGEIAPNTGYRKGVAEAGIDKFVLDMSDENFARYPGDYGTGCQHGKYIGNVRDRYVRYLREVVGRPNASVLSYEEMVLDFPTWLRRLLSGFGLSDADETYRFIRSRVEIQNDVTGHRPGSDEALKAGAEDIRSHKRKATPGDYKEKLRPETISELNRRFSEVLDALGYSGPQYETNHIPGLK
jgi:hypothetical protein